MSKPYVKYFKNASEAENWLMNAGYQPDRKNTTVEKFVYVKTEEVKTKDGETVEKEKTAEVTRAKEGYKTSITSN